MNVLSPFYCQRDTRIGFDWEGAGKNVYDCMALELCPRVFPWEEAIEAVIIEGERTAGCPRFLKLYGKDRFELGANAALSSGATVSRLIKVLSRWARRRPALLERAAMDAQSRLKRASRYRSEGIREMEGLSGGLGISLEDLLAARSIIEFCAAARDPLRRSSPGHGWALPVWLRK